MKIDSFSTTTNWGLKEGRGPLLWHLFNFVLTARVFPAKAILVRQNSLSVKFEASEGSWYRDGLQPKSGYAAGWYLDTPPKRQHIPTKQNSTT